MMIVLLILDRNEERGEELKVPHHARATSTRDGNMPRVTATCLIPDNRNYILYFYKAVNNYYNIRELITVRQVNYKVN